MIPTDTFPHDLLTVAERRAMMRVPTHDADGTRLAEWERLLLATHPF